MIRRADIEGSKSYVAMNAWQPQASSVVPNLLQAFPNEVIVPLDSQYCTYKRKYLQKQIFFFPQRKKLTRAPLLAGIARTLRKLNWISKKYIYIFIFFSVYAHLTVRYDAHCKISLFCESPRSCPRTSKLQLFFFVKKICDWTLNCS
jgi:hypothetical protein